MLFSRFSLVIDSYSFILSDEITHLILHVVLFPLRLAFSGLVALWPQLSDEFKASCDFQIVQISVVVTSVLFSTFSILSRLQFFLKKERCFCKERTRINVLLNSWFLSDPLYMHITKPRHQYLHDWIQKYINGVNDWSNLVYYPLFWLNYILPKFICWTPSPNMTIFEDRDFKEVIKFKWGIRMQP